MGFTMLTGDAELPVMFNTIYSVGLNSTNYFKDVKLVQYLLKHIYAAGAYAAPTGTMSIDGVCGPITKRWIKTFQDQMKGESWCMNVDGRVDRMPAKAEDCVVTYTIALLNYELRRLNPNAWTLLPSLVPLSPGTPPGSPASPVYVPPSGGA